MNSSIPETARIETKYIIEDIYKNEILSWIKLNKSMFIIPYPDRCVNNIYFDDYDYSIFSQNVSGISERYKVRYRWYGESDILQKGFLEIKCKRNQFGWKLRFAVNEIPFPQ